MRAFGFFLALLLAALAAVALLTYPAWLLLHPHFDFPFHRIGERIGMLALFAGFIALARRLGLNDRASLGYGLPRRAFLGELGLALGLGVASMLAVVGLMCSLGLIEWRPGSPGALPALARVTALSALSGIAVALIEETFVRGAMHTAIARESGTRTAIVLTALFYAATHFFATSHIAADAVSARSGIELLAGTLSGFAHPAGIVDAFLALTAVGVVLGLVRAATGNIAACIGLHAGWVWVMLVCHALAQPAPTARLGFLLSRHDGFVGWLVLAWTLIVALPLWRFYRHRDAGRSAGASRAL